MFSLWSNIVTDPCYLLSKCTPIDTSAMSQLSSSLSLYRNGLQVVQLSILSKVMCRKHQKRGLYLLVSWPHHSFETSSHCFVDYLRTKSVSSTSRTEILRVLFNVWKLTQADLRDRVIGMESSSSQPCRC